MSIFDSKDNLWDRLQRNLDRQSELAHEERIAEIRAQSHAMVWTGTQEEFVESILRLYESGCIVALDATDALIKAGLHFVRPDGTAIIRPNEAATALVPVPSPETTPLPRAAIVLPLLEAKGWSVLDWANDAGVASATAHDYLAGKTSPYRSTRVKLAKSLGVSVQQLPR